MDKKKTKLNKKFTKLTHKGVSLIVLIVIIIVIVILAATVILTLSKNNPVESAREAKFKEDIRSFQDDLALSISKDYTAEEGPRNYKFSAMTYDEIKDYIPSFTKDYEGKLIVKNYELMYEETVTEKEARWFEELGIKKKISAKSVAEKPQEYYGKNITNYSANEVTEWKIFHSDGKNVYLITSDYVDVSKLPAPKAGGSKPKNINKNYPKAAPLTNVLAGYSGSSNITDEKIKALNSEYFNKGYTSTNPNMRAVAYMLDTGIWNDFVGENAEYAIGGPTIELLMESYSKSHKVDYRARSRSDIGYQISNNGGKGWSSFYNGMLSTSDSLYVIINTANAYEMWVASPSSPDPNHVMGVNYTGRVGNADFHAYSSYGIGFRPIVCLKSNVILEAYEDGYNIK